MAKRLGLRTAQTKRKDQFISGALPDKRSMDAALAALEKATWTLASVDYQNGSAARWLLFITSQLQRDAASKLGFNVAGRWA